MEASWSVAALAGCTGLIRLPHRNNDHLEAVRYGSVTKRQSTEVNARRRMKKRGFTIVELLVVIAINGLLVALLLPAVDAASKPSILAPVETMSKAPTLSTSLSRERSG
jgi:prepilin-type N-terminal cleavage/methylation domain-containing protein